MAIIKRFKVTPVDSLITWKPSMNSVTLSGFVRYYCWSEEVVDAVSDLKIGESCQSKYYIIDRIE